MNRFVACMLMAGLSIAGCSSDRLVDKKDKEDTQNITSAVTSANHNAAYLGHNYTTGSTDSTTYLSNFITNSSTLNVDYLFVNVGTFNSSGNLPAGSNPYVQNFLSTLSAQGIAQSRPIQAIAWLNSNLSVSGLDITNSALRQSMVNECSRFTRYANENGSLGSYIGADSVSAATTVPDPVYTGDAVRFQGCLWDIEYDGAYSTSRLSGMRQLTKLTYNTLNPSGGTRFKNIIYPGFITSSSPIPGSAWWTYNDLTLFLGTYGITGLVPHQYSSSYTCTVAGCPNTSCTIAANNYCNLITGQIQQFFNAVNSTPGGGGVTAQLWFGLPAHRNSPLTCSQDPSIEAMWRGASCTKAGIDDLVAHGTTNPTTGAAVFEHVDGKSTNDSYAQYSTTSNWHDWPDYCVNWLGTTCNSLVLNP